jgi:dihydroorotate dehydrogenase
MSLYGSFVKPILFSLDAETAHHLAFTGIRSGLVSGRQVVDPILRQVLFGTHFPNPLGLAAGFDKNALALNRWARLGFGFAEVGTVTFWPQPGNSRPRLFRIVEDEAILNRMGFNNDGAAAIAKRVAKATPTIPLGINIGKNREVELADAAANYLDCFKVLANYGAYFVVNVSSPNTPGLRELQDRGPLSEIMGLIRAEAPERPLFVKIAPDLETPALDEVIQVASEHRLTGIIAGNTTLSREGVRTLRSEYGGISGRPLKARANFVMRYLYSACDRDMILIGAGGIMDGRDLYDRIASGAHLCQTYTGFVYGGVDFVSQALASLVREMGEKGMTSLAELRGSSVRS